MGSQTEERPDYGPEGYLPPRAAHRARKIVLRERMGLQWPVAALVAAAVVALGGGAFLLSGARGPGEPFVEVGPLAAFAPRTAETVMVSGEEALVVRAGGGIRVLVPPEDDAVVFCAPSRRLETADGVWTPDGRLVGGDAAHGSLPRLRATIFDGRVFVDPTSRYPGADPASAGETPQCQ